MRYFIPEDKPPEEPKPPPIPLWRRPAVFGLLCAVLSGAGTFAWTQRRAIRRIAAPYLPRAERVGRDLGQAVDDFAETYAPTEAHEPERLPSQPSADTLSAPVDPTSSRRITRTRTTGRRSLAGKRHIGERRMASAAGAVEYRQRMDGPWLLDEFHVPFWQTPMGIGIKTTASAAVFFGLLGFFLFRNINKHGRTF